MCASSQEMIEAHLDEVEDMLEVGDPVKFAFWTLDQDSRSPPIPPLTLASLPHATARHRTAGLSSQLLRGPGRRAANVGQVG